jgi:hypothetical protein
VSALERKLIRCIEKTRRDLAGVTASTVGILARLDIYVPERTLRYKLLQMERSGLVRRPLGPKSGWALALPVRQGLRAANRQLAYTM